METGRVLGRYRLVRQLGQGGMGSVWAAVHLELGTPAAVKLMDPNIARNPAAIARFKREAQAAASLRSANIVQILDYGVQDETPFIVMEMLEGEDLRARLDRQGPMDPRAVALVLHQAGKAVSRAHEHGIVHRDLKPDNLFLARDGADELVKVLDFGIAKASATLEGSPGLATQTGAILGTIYYMSPEQTTGQRSVDHRTDIWAFAVIGYECITGRRPFDGDTLGGVVLAICAQPLPVPSQVAVVPPGFDAWFARGTHRDPAQRFASVTEQMAALCSLCGLPMASLGLGLGWAATAGATPAAAGASPTAVGVPPATSGPPAATGGSALASRPTTAVPTTQPFGATPRDPTNATAGPSTVTVIPPNRPGIGLALMVGMALFALAMVGAAVAAIAVFSVQGNETAAAASSEAVASASSAPPAPATDAVSSGLTDPALVAAVSAASAASAASTASAASSPASTAGGSTPPRPPVGGAAKTAIPSARGTATARPRATAAPPARTSQPSAEDRLAL